MRSKGKPIVHASKLTDHFSSELKIGDIVLGATPRRNYFTDVTYSIAVIIDRTASMIRLHKLGEMASMAHWGDSDILGSVKQRGGRKGGRVPPSSVIKIRSTGITKEQFDAVNVIPNHVLPDDCPSLNLLP